MCELSIRVEMDSKGKQRLPLTIILKYMVLMRQSCILMKNIMEI